MEFFWEIFYASNLNENIFFATFLGAFLWRFPCKIASKVPRNILHASRGKCLPALTRCVRRGVGKVNEMIHWSFSNLFLILFTIANKQKVFPPSRLVFLVVFLLLSVETWNVLANRFSLCCWDDAEHQWNFWYTLVQQEAIEQICRGRKALFFHSCVCLSKKNLCLFSTGNPFGVGEVKALLKDLQLLA